MRLNGVALVLPTSSFLNISVLASSETGLLGCDIMYIGDSSYGKLNLTASYPLSMGVTPALSAHIVGLVEITNIDRRKI
jgi:hypothetical protein